MPLKLHRRGKIWHYSGTVAGRRLRNTTGTAEKAIAERIASEVEHKAWQRRFDGPGAGLTMAQAFLTYIEDGGEHRFINKPSSYFKDTPVSEITGEAIRRGARQTYPNGSAATRNRQFIVPTVAAINHASELGWCQPIRVKRFKVSPNTKTPADLAWVNAFATKATELWLPDLSAL